MQWGAIPRLVLATLVVAAVLPGSAPALTLGSLDPVNVDPTASDYCVAGPGNFIQGSIASGFPSYTVPQGGGTITSWSTRWGVPGSSVALEVWRSDPTTSGQYILVAKDSELISPNGVGVSTYPVSIPVSGGEYIGIGWPSANTVDCSYQTPDDSNTMWGKTGSTFNPGDTADFGNFIVVRDVLNLTARLHQRADLRLRQKVSRSVLVPGDAVDFVLSARNSGPSPVLATLSDRLPRGLRFFSAAASSGICSGKKTVRCSLFLPVGGSRTISIVAIARSLGKKTNSASLRSSATDATPADNVARTSVRVVSKRH